MSFSKLLYRRSNDMKDEIVNRVMQQMASSLENLQLKKLKGVMEDVLKHCEVI